MNSKIDDISDKVHELKSGYEYPRKENEQLKQQVADLQFNVDRLDGNMKRKNLRIQGVPGQVREPRSVTERKAREILENDLKCDYADRVPIDDVRRVRSSNPAKPTILVTFANSGDCTNIMQMSKDNLQRDSTVYVQYDYTDRVRKHRKILGERMVTERQNGNYSSVRHDKLIINDYVYKYSDASQSIVCIGRRQASTDQNVHYRDADNQSTQASGTSDRTEMNRVVTENDG